jgi:hypothetical protein
MTMHLHHPSLSLTGKRKGKKKFASAEHKRKAEQLDKEWKELQKRWGVEQEDRKRKRALDAEPLAYSMSVPAGRETRHIPSLDTGHKGAVTSAEIPKYTGTKIKGIGTMHKSNAVPIFSDEEAKNIASMRR